jgi:hypothetical protein
MAQRGGNLRNMGADSDLVGVGAQAGHRVGIDANHEALQIIRVVHIVDHTGRKSRCREVLIVW